MSKNTSLLGEATTNAYFVQGDTTFTSEQTDIIKAVVAQNERERKQVFANPPATLGAPVMKMFE